MLHCDALYLGKSMLAANMAHALPCESDQHEPSDAAGGYVNDFSGTKLKNLLYFCNGQMTIVNFSSSRDLTSSSSFVDKLLHLFKIIL